MVSIFLLVRIFLFSFLYYLDVSPAVFFVLDRINEIDYMIFIFQMAGNYATRVSRACTS